MLQKHNDKVPRYGARRTLRFPADHSIGRVLIRDEAEAARTVEAWCRWAATEREDLRRRLRVAGLAPAWRAAELKYQEDAGHGSDTC